ncbi:OmpH family outer membrane protein [Geobacter sp. AOG2]|uniref:OmpH family outer membrane protein n=1 Tax=Geobacter sp. AOG2 TaxID=1566347 RepID=UPI001CC36AD5|nr:OmpH family outer membrane protein [Geobacter sp. AOG2]GFE62020.1 hypothetical protein AOG2_26080 [Geobacter sp. AOG2]
MPTILKMCLIITLALSLPNLAAAADAPPTAVAKPAALPEPLQKAPAVSAAETKPSDAAVRQMTKIGSVDLVRIGTETLQGKAIEAKLKGMKDKFQGRVDAKRKQLDKLRASLEAKLPTLSQTQREAKAREFQKKVEEFQKFGKQMEEELYTTQEKETKTLYDATEAAAVAYGKANGFAVIVIKKELLYVGSNIDAQDVTDAIIKAMDEATKKK